MYALLRRYRELLLVAVLLLLPLGVFFAHAKRPSELSRFDKFLLALTAPVEKLVSWTVMGIHRGVYGYVALRHAREQAFELSRKVTALELERQQLVEARDENLRLRGLLAMAEAMPQRKHVGARVVGVRLDPKGLQIVTVDRGANHGIARMMPVVLPQGVVGRIHSVYASSSDVLLLTDRNSSVAVRVDRSRARGNVRGTGSTDTCKLDYALRSEDMIEGDLLVTAGTDGVFPRGLPVGRVTNVKRTGFGLYQLAEVVPTVDVTKLEEVLVVTSYERLPDEPPAAAQVQGPLK